MIVNMNKSIFDNANDEKLFKMAIEPIAKQMHSRFGPRYKFTLYKELTKGQKAAFMFWILYYHSSIEIFQFYTWIPYMRYSSQNYWNELIAGMNLLNCDKMLQFITECEEVFQDLETKNQSRDSKWVDFHLNDLDLDPILKLKVLDLHLKFKELTKIVFPIIIEYIRNNHNEFVAFT